MSLQCGGGIELLGFPIVLQIATIAPGTNAGNLVFSNGLLATFGTH